MCRGRGLIGLSGAERIGPRTFRVGVTFEQAPYPRRFDDLHSLSSPASLLACGLTKAVTGVVSESFDRGAFVRGDAGFHRPA
jgi:hypothetical protein